MVYGELVLESGTIQNISTLEAGFAVLLYGGKFTLNDGTVQSVNTSNYAISSYEVDGNAEIVINGGIINGKRGCLAVECGTYAIVNGGEFNVTDAIGGHCVYVTDATIEINDGIFYPYSTNACSSYAVLAYNAAASVTINGGVFNASAPASNVYASAGAITIGGGEFALEPISTYLKEGYAAIKDLDGNYVVGVKPTATVNNMGSMVIPGGEYGVWNGSSYTGTSTENMPLSFVMQFLADQTAADMENSPYADWYADFVITFTGLENESFVADGCYLAGFYGDFGWVKVPVDGMTIENGVRYPVMLGVGLGQKYDYVCSGVQDFKCALYLTPEILAANPNIQVNLELAVVDNSNGSDAALGALIDGETIYKVVDYNYDAEDFVVVAQVGNKTYATLQEAFAAAQDGETVVLLADVELDASIKITEGNVTFDLNGNKITGPDVPATQSYYAFIVDGGSLTLKDSVGGGEIWAKCYGIETKSGSFTMESGIITATNNKTLGTAIANYGGTVIINGGTLSGALGSVYTDGYFANADTTIYGGTFNGYVTVGDSNQNYSETVTSASNDYTVLPDYKWVEQDGVYVLTAKVYVAAIGEAKYESLQEAIDAANGETVVLLAPITVNKGEELVIDLKGQTVTYSVTATITKSVAMITNKGTLTIKDSVGDGKLSLAYTGASFGYGVGLYTISNEGGTLNIAGGTIENLATVSGSMYDAIDNNSTIGNTVLNISGGNIYCSYIAIRQFANSTTYTNTVNVTGGTINGGNCAIWTQNPGSKQPLADIAISGGKFTGRILLGESSGFDVAISGGTYDRAVAEEFCAEGYIPVDNGDGTYGVKEGTFVAEVGGVKYESLQDAINAAGEGDTITLLADITVSSDLADAANGLYNIAADDKITIDLGGKTIDVTDNSTGNFIVFYNYGELTIKNGTVNVTSTNNRLWNAQSTIILNRGGILTIESGSYVHNGGTDMAITVDNSGNSFGDAYLYVNGGTIESTYVGIRLRMADPTLNGNPGNGLVYTEITDGEIYGGTRGIWAQITNATSDELGSLAITGGTIGGGNNSLRITTDGHDNIDVTISGDAVINGAILGEGSDFAITGGTFNTPVAAELCADGYIPCDNGDGTYGVEKINLIEWGVASVTAGTNLDINFYIKNSSIDPNVKYYAKITKVHTDSCGDASYTYYIAQDKWVPDEMGNYTAIVVKNIAAKEMNCWIDVQIFVGEEPAEGEAEGAVASEEAWMSVSYYATTLLRSTNDESLKRLLVNMLNYGAEAQKYFDHDASNLANSNLTEAEKAYATPEADLENKYATPQDGFAYNASVTLKDTIYLNFNFINLKTIEGYDHTMIDAVIKYTTHGSSEETTYLVDNATIGLTENSTYAKIAIMSLSAADVDTIVTCELRYDGEVISTISANIAYYCWYSIEYQTEEAAICDAMMKYGQSAFNYFESKTISDNT